MPNTSRASLGISAVLITREKEYPKDIRLDFPFDEVIVQTECPNVLRRFELAREARNEIIYVQDDDAAINIATLYSHYDDRLTNAITPGHLQIYNGLCGNRVTLIGWGCFFPKRLLRVLDFYPEPLDPIEVDRIFTHLVYRQEGRHNSVVMPIRQFQRERAICRGNPNHYRERDALIRKLEKEL